MKIKKAAGFDMFSVYFLGLHSRKSITISNTSKALVSFQHELVLGQEYVEVLELLDVEQQSTASFLRSGQSNKFPGSLFRGATTHDELKLYFSGIVTPLYTKCIKFQAYCVYICFMYSLRYSKAS
jgi:hypothetical protein